jgi:hypothetical protein
VRVARWLLPALVLVSCLYGDWAAAAAIALVCGLYLWPDMPERLTNVLVWGAGAAFVIDLLRSGWPWWVVTSTAAGCVVLGYAIPLVLVWRLGERDTPTP